METGQPPDTWQLKIDGQTTDCADEFCYAGSVITNTSSCDKVVRTRIGKANSACKRLDYVWRQKITSQGSTVLAILLCCA